MSTSFTPGQLLTHTFAITKVSKKTSKTGDIYESLALVSPDLSLTATIWGNSELFGKLKESVAYEITGEAGSYMNKPTLTIHDAKISDQLFSSLLPTLPTIVFDIETLGKKYEELTSSEKDYLAHLHPDISASELGEKTALHPIFGSVIYVAMYNPDSKKGVIFGTGDKDNKPEDTNFIYQNCTDEKDLLIKIWSTLGKYSRFVSYNGKGFDYPFLLFRSLYHHVQVMPGLDSYTAHFDLAKLLRPGNSQYKLSAICQALGVEDPKSKGVSGLHVSRLYRDGKYQEIIDYVARDVIATSKLYELLKTTAPMLVI